MALIRTEAFVIQSFRFSETSMIYRLLTADHGVVPVIAKGTLRPKSRFGAALGPFRRLGVTYYAKESRDIQTLSDAELIQEYPAVEQSLERMQAGGSWFRFIRRITPEGAPAQPIYGLASIGMGRLAATAADRTRRWETYHRAATASILGLAPRLDACTLCGRDLPDENGLAFSIEDGGLVCSGCRHERPQSRKLPSREFAMLALYLHPDYALINQLQNNVPQEVKAQDLIYHFIAYHTDSPRVEK